jgi:hypothetical protein
MHARVSMHMPYLPHPHERKVRVLETSTAGTVQAALSAQCSMALVVFRRLSPFFVFICLTRPHIPTQPKHSHAVGNKCHGTIKHHLPPSYDRLPSLLRSIFSLPVFICPVYRALHDSRLGSTRIHVWHEYIVCTLYACHIYYRSYSISRDYRFGFSFKTQSRSGAGK